MVVFSEIDLDNNIIDICIECDASLAGLGAFCNGQSARGHWPTLEAQKDINLAIVKRQYPKAVYTHCMAHRLNLSVASTCKMQCSEHV